MAKNEKYHKSKNLKVPVTAGTVSGSPVLVGSMPGFALTDRVDGEATVRFTGSFTHKVNSTIANIGDPVYYTEDSDPENRLTTVSDGNTFFGYALGTGSNDELPVRVGEAFAQDALRIISAVYDVEDNGGDQGTHDLGTIVPKNAIILDGIVDIVEGFDNGGTATVELGFGEGDDTDDLMTAKTEPSVGLEDVEPDGTASNAIKMAEDREITATIGADDMEEGRLIIFLYYVMSEDDE